MLPESDSKPEAENMIFRVLGVIVGAAFLIGASLMIFIGDVDSLQIVSLLCLGGTFLLYGLGGNKALAKVVPWLAK